MKKAMYATLAFAAAVAFAGPAFAEKFKATLDGKSEVPPNASAGTGTADIDYDPATKKLSWKVTYSGLSGPATAAHFHGPAEAGTNAGVASYGGAEPFTESRKHDRQPNSCCGLRP